ncbi:glycosyltransferase [uncultured Sphingomonas sp.]|uniref:glycosyltransferase n=1 Tax=uncultured Sphingomonas sp. TaxID=158754 RepID=UPI0025E7CE73|nr:glycosyltransferase [uncultured Sphingomonas sp.]
MARAGHAVTVVHTGEVARYIHEPGVSFAPLPDDAVGASLDTYLARLAAPTGLGGLTRMISATADMTARLLDGAPAVLDRIKVDAVIADSAEPAGALIAQHLRIPHVVSVTGLPLLREDDVPPPFVRWRYRPDRLGRFRNRGGYGVANLLMRPIDAVVRGRRRDWNIDDAVQPLAYVAQCPRGLDYPRRDLPAHFHYGSPWRASARAEVDLPIGDRPLVFCSLGSLQGSRKALFASMSAACAAIGARAVIGHGGGLTPADEAALPGQPLVRAFWPQEAVLRRCSAAILHGGFNTVLDALAAGVPIVAVPIAFEQPGTAARLARIGAAQVITPRQLSVTRLAHALRHVVVDPGYRQAAMRVAAEMDAVGGARAAAAIVSAALASAP